MMNLPAIPLLLLVLLLPNSAVLMEGPTPTLSASSPIPPTPLLPLSTSPSPSNETQPLLLSSPPPQQSPLPEETLQLSSSPSSSSESPSQSTTSITTTRPPLTPVVYWMFSTTSAYSTCPESDQIHCGTSDRCTRIRYICDGDNDCGDSTDEASSLCEAWRNSDCDRNLAKCTRMGRTDCIAITNYCTVTDPPCVGNLDMRLCVMLNNGKIQPLSELQPYTTPALTTMAPTTHMPIYVLEEIWNNNFEEKLNHTISHPDCPQLYTRVGNQCLSVFFIGNMTWLESRAFCRAIGGDLFTLGKDFTSYTTLVQHLTTNGVTADLWIGGRYVNETAGWAWVDNTPLPTGSPFWAVRYKEECSTRPIPYLNDTQPANDGACYHYQQAPPALPTRHCVAATYQHYFYLTDENCFTKKSPLCVMPGEKKQQAH